MLSGADYRYGSYNNVYKSVSSFGPYNSTFRDTSVSQTSMYASLSFIDAKKHLSVELGGRLNTHSRYNFNYTYTFNPAYNFNDNWRVFGSVATGFKAPSLYQLYASPFIGGNPNLKPEKSINYEIGVQQQATTLKNRLVFFYRDITDGIDYSSIASNGYPTGYFNYASQRVKGIEYEVSVNPTEKLTISGNYAFLVGEEVTQSRINFKDTSYSYLLRRPKHNINIAVSYQFTKALYASVRSKYVSDRKDIGGYAKADVGLDGYFIMAATASYEINKLVKVFADAQNITNKQFFDVRGYNALPALFNVGITVNW